MSTDPAALAASIAAALAATDTAARALWEAMGAPWRFRFGSADRSVVTTFFGLPSSTWGSVRLAGVDDVTVTVFDYATNCAIFRHTGTLDSARAALAAYLGAS